MLDSFKSHTPRGAVPDSNPVMVPVEDYQGITAGEKLARQHARQGAVQQTLDALSTMAVDCISEVTRADILAEAYRNCGEHKQLMADRWKNLPPENPLRKHVAGLARTEEAEAQLALATAGMYETYAQAARERSKIEQRSGATVSQ